MKNALSPAWYWRWEERGGKKYLKYNSLYLFYRFIRYCLILFFTKPRFLKPYLTEKYNHWIHKNGWWDYGNSGRQKIPIRYILLRQWKKLTSKTHKSTIKI